MKLRSVLLPVSKEVKRYQHNTQCLWYLHHLDPFPHKTPVTYTGRQSRRKKFSHKERHHVVYDTIPRYCRCNQWCLKNTFPSIKGISRGKYTALLPLLVSILPSANVREDCPSFSRSCFVVIFHVFWKMYPCNCKRKVSEWLYRLTGYVTHVKSVDKLNHLHCSQGSLLNEHHCFS
jgi:hypothetical protein